MKLLAVDTATEACSAALFLDGEVIESFKLAPKEHAQLILPMIDALMAEAGLKPMDLDGLAFGRGPGSFTGVRIATGVIQGIALGLDIPVVPVSTLAAIAQDFFDIEDKFQGGFLSTNVAFTAMDARMGEIFWGVYQRDQQGFAELLGKEAVTPAENVEFPERTGVGVGSGWGVYQSVLMNRLTGWVNRCEADLLPRAGVIARLGAYGFDQGKAVAVEQAMPVYLRDKVAKKESER
ncbi:MAG: tRNA (adenosine(37)-N6)-threonylcarbamoyltransferase complex dimerization subunit type 1 TsaB [Methylococcaceae bacterium]|nr:tRNA (adenosine(37)-N6)-threonylcarbamoyltransferase complex dimerization subunit type 1 TsaB [Methylococcaceae bacterium]